MSAGCCLQSQPPELLTGDKPASASSLAPLRASSGFLIRTYPNVCFCGKEISLSLAYLVGL